MNNEKFDHGKAYKEAEANTSLCSGNGFSGCDIRDDVVNKVMFSANLHEEDVNENPYDMRRN